MLILLKAVAIKKANLFSFTRNLILVTILKNALELLLLRNNGKFCFLVKFISFISNFSSMKSQTATSSNKFFARWYVWSLVLIIFATMQAITFHLFLKKFHIWITFNHSPSAIVSSRNKFPKQRFQAPSFLCLGHIEINYWMRCCGFWLCPLGSWLPTESLFLFHKKYLMFVIRVSFTTCFLYLDF